MVGAGSEVIGNRYTVAFVADKDTIYYPATAGNFASQSILDK
jgi:hypothetical protein